MSALSDTPGLIAGGTIGPYALVYLSASADATALVATATTRFVVGVTDGSTRQFDSANHAIAGDPVTLQGGDVVLVKAGTGGVTAGDILTADAAGTVVTAGTTATASGALNNHTLIALETGAAGAIVRAVWAKNHVMRN